ncbi:hypothetical protein NHX12_022157 [Muraenolepis orangiensis]|uniref:Uncharacterized protein n=1 Tax=Muraenolepis orangiensis TaxID=630683 RepID=A0A9Q0ITZ0_9TELE|nr:hypothetical protein NHX12_022157 [Muraenolepis orangiensis]
MEPSSHSTKEYPIMQCGDRYNMRTDPVFSRETSKLLRAASLPSVGRGNPTGELSSITISTRTATAARSGSYECVFASRPDRALTSVVTRPPAESSRIIRRLTSTRRPMPASCSQPDLCGRSSIAGLEEEIRCCDSAVDKDRPKPSPKGSEREHPSKDPQDRDVRRDSSWLHRSWVHLQLPLRSSFSVVFWDKPLWVPLEGAGSRRDTLPSIHRSTCSLRLAASHTHTLPADSQAAAESARGGGGGIHVLECRSPECRSPQMRGPRPRQRRPHASEGPAVAHGVDYKAEVLVFRGIGRQPAEARRGDGDEERCSSRSDLKTHRALAASPGMNHTPLGLKCTRTIDL